MPPIPGSLPSDAPMTGFSEASPFQSLCDELESLWHEGIPLTIPLGVKVRYFDGETLELAADLEPNRNVHGTAFAGSLYAITALCGWSMLHLQLACRDLTAAIVIASGQINYPRPVAETIVARCSFGDQEAALRDLEKDGRMRIHLTASVAANGVEAAVFEGDFSARSAAPAWLNGL